MTAHVRLTGPLLAVCLLAALPTLAQPAPAEGPTMSAQEKAQKQTANEEAETLCRSIKDQDKFYECLDLYFLDAQKFKAFLEQNGVSKPAQPGK